jgi:hypothetical protein
METSNMKKYKSLLQKMLSMLEGQLSQAWNAKYALKLNLKINPKPNFFSFLVRYKWRVLGKAFVKYPSLWYHMVIHTSILIMPRFGGGGDLRKLHFSAGPLLVYEELLRLGWDRCGNKGKGLLALGPIREGSNVMRSQGQN